MKGFRVIQNSDQIKDYLLCESCEKRFRINGEDWILKHCCRSRSGTPFRLREILTASDSVAGDEGTKLCLAAENPRIDSEKILYFAASVFWRAAVHQYRLKNFSVHQPNLGPYLDELRLYLAGESSFPQKATVVVWVTNLAKPLPMLMPPKSISTNHHIFHLPGIGFELYLGGRIRRSATRISFTLDERPMFFSAAFENKVREMMSAAYRVSVRPAHLP